MASVSLAVGVVGNHGKVKLIRQLNREGIAGHDADFGTVRPCAQGLEHIEQHGLREFGAGGLIEQGGEALLGARRDF